MRRGRIGRHLAALPVAVLTGSLAPQVTVTAQAAPLPGPIIVVPCGSAGALVAAIAQANSAGAGTLVLTAGCVYTLTKVDNTDVFFGANGLPVITGQVSVVGRGATIARSTAAGTPAFRIVEVAPNASFVLDSVTVSNGLSPLIQSGPWFYGLGGGIENDGGIVSLVHSTVSGNSASATETVCCSGGAFGGGIDNELGTLVLTDSTVRGNTVDATGVKTPFPASGVGRAWGAGITNFGGTVVAERSTLSGNTARATGGSAQAGAIFQCGQFCPLTTPLGSVAAASVTLLDSVVSGNVITSNNTNGGITFGGGLVDDSGIVDIERSTISNNVADASSGGYAFGGGIEEGGILTLTDTVVTGNTAASPGGLVLGGGIMDQGIAVVPVGGSVTGNSPDNCDPPGQVHGCFG